MRFNPKAKLDPSQIDDRTGGGGGGGGFPGGGGGGGGITIPAGGGVVGVIIAIIAAVVFGQDIFSGAPADQGTPDQPSSSGIQGTCTAEQANTDQKCRLEAITNSVQAFWAKEFPEQTGRDYQQIQTVPFSNQVTTQGCGTASADVGPFYCPNDQRVYLDLRFFRDLLQNQLGAKDSAFTEAYVVAHEYGHHIENQLGVMGQVRTQQGADSDSVKLELMADCLAGVWAKGATETTDAEGNKLITDLTQQDIEDGITAAKAVGDDAIQSRTSGRVNPDGWTHGSSAQRIAAFDSGLKGGTIRGCNYFDGAQEPRA